MRQEVNDFGRGDRLPMSAIRYPGTWDTNETQRRKIGGGTGPGRRSSSRTWSDRVRSCDERWDTAMQRRRRLVAPQRGLRITTAVAKQSQLEREIHEVASRLLQLSRGWVVDPDANVNRQKRLRAAQHVVDWLLEREDVVYHRVHALRESLGIHEGDEISLADCMEIASRRHGAPLPRQLRAFLHDWATMSVPKRWDEFTTASDEGAPWLAPSDVHALARYLSDYLLRDEVFDELTRRLEPIVGLKTRDKRRRALLCADHHERLAPEPGPKHGSDPRPTMRPQNSRSMVDRPTALGGFGLMARLSSGTGALAQPSRWAATRQIPPVRN